MKHKLEKQAKEKSQRQRYVFIAIILAVVVITNAGTYFLSSKNGEGLGQSQFSLLNPARAFIKQKDLIINLQPLRDYLNEKYEDDKIIG